MIAYFDTSSIVPMLIREENEGLCRSIWDDATRVVTSRITFVEAHAAVAAAERSGRIDSPQAKAARTRLGEMWSDTFIVEVGAELTYAAAACAKEFGLLGFDAIHCASAMTIGAADVLAVSSDQRLLAAWLRGGLNVTDTALDAEFRVGFPVLTGDPAHRVTDELVVEYRDDV